MSAEVSPPVVDLAHEADFRLGDLEIRPSRRGVASGADQFILEPRVMRVLVALARSRGQVVSRDELIASCWDGRIVGDDAINACVAKVRRTGEIRGAFRIETVPRVGYRMLARRSAASDVVLAVLPFDNLSGDAGFAYFSDGVSEEILHALAQRADLRVIGRASSFQFRGSEKSVVRVGRELGATHVLDGAVRRSGQRTRISAQLVDCATQITSWEDQFECELSDIFALQDEIAGAVARSMRVALAPAVRSGGVDAAAYDLFLRGSVRPDHLSAASLRQQLVLLEEAVRRAPAFAEAHAGLGYVRSGLALFLPAGEASAMRAQAVGAADHALALDPRCALAAVALARAAPRHRRLIERETWLCKAIEWAPSEALPHRDYARHLASVGRREEALLAIRQAHRLDPLHVDTVAMLGRTLAETGDYREAEAVLSAGMRRWPEFELFPVWLTVTRTAAGDIAGAASIRAQIPNATFSRELETFPATYSGDPAAVDGFMQRVRRFFRETGRITIADLCVAARVGQAEEALDLAFEAASEPSRDRRSYDAGAYNTALLFAAFNREIRGASRFVALCAKYGLVDYWLTAGVWPDCVEEVAPRYDFRAECRRVAQTCPHD